MRFMLRRLTSICRCLRRLQTAFQDDPKMKYEIRYEGNNMTVCSTLASPLPAVL